MRRQHIRAHILNLLSSAAERAAHNCEVGGSKPPGGKFHLSSFREAVRQAGRKTQYTTHHRHGAEEARGAHNSEDIGSKPIAGILHHFASNVQDISRTKHHTIQAVGLSDFKRSGDGLIVNI